MPRPTPIAVRPDHHEPPPTVPLLAYRAADEIGLVDGTDVIATASGAFAVQRSDHHRGRPVRVRAYHDNQVATLDVATRAATRAVPVGPVREPPVAARSCGGSSRTG